eukprot:9473918-Pyramimonas_sp.AAC.1
MSPGPRTCKKHRESTVGTRFENFKIPLELRWNSEGCVWACSVASQDPRCMIMRMCAMPVEGQRM